jgi:hypothetical protein
MSRFFIFNLFVFCTVNSFSQRTGFLYEGWVDFHGPGQYTQDSISSNGTCHSLKQALRHRKSVRALSIREFGFEKLDDELKKLKGLRNLRTLTIGYPINHFYSGDKKVYRYNLYKLAGLLPRLKQLRYLTVVSPDTSMLLALEKMEKLEGLNALIAENIGYRTPFFTDFSKLKNLDSLKLLGFFGGSRSIYELSGLKYLCMSFGQDSIQSLKGLTGLKMLVVDYNGGNAMPAAIGEITGLESLCGTGTLTWDIGDSFENLKKLKYLRICPYKEVPPGIFNLSSLEKLFLSGGMRVIPQDLNKLNKLKTLTLFDCSVLKKIDFNPAQLDSLSEVIIYNDNSDSLYKTLDLSLIGNFNHKIKLAIRGINLSFLTEKVVSKISELKIETNWKEGIPYPGENQVDSMRNLYPKIVIRLSESDIYKDLFRLN